MEPFSSMSMNSTPLSLAKIKNDMERIRYRQEMKHLQYAEQLSRFNLKKDQDLLKNDFEKMVAYGCICKVHSFDKYDPFLRRQECKMNSKKNSKKHSRRYQEQEARQQEAEVSHLPEIQNKSRSVYFDDTSSRDASSVNSQETSTTTVSNSESLGLPKLPLTEENSQNNDTFGIQLGLGDREDSKIRMPTLAVGFHALCIWKQKVHGGVKPQKPVSEAPRRSIQKILKEIKNTTRENQRASVFPGDCKTPATMRRFLDHEVEHFLCNAKSDKRKIKTRKILENLKVPQFVNRHQSTSAIFREFRSFKDSEMQDDKFI